MKRKLIALTVILLIINIIFAFLTAVYHTDWLLSVTITTGTILYHFAMRLIVGFSVPEKWNPNSPWFRQKPFEKRLYKKIGVKKWKNKLPTFDPDSFDLEKHSLYEVIETMCKSEVVHEVIMVLSFVPLFFIIFAGTPAVFIITSVIAAMFDGVFVVMQRYNRPRLMKIYNRIGK